VFAFAEFYPNPFKPYLDAQFAETIADGHDLFVFAFGSWGDPGSRVIADYQLERRTRYIPATPRQVARFVAPSLIGAVRHRSRLLRVTHDEPGSLRDRLVGAAQASLLPLEEPDLCFIHDLGTAVRLTALRSIYPQARRALYYHGGEIAGGIVKDEATARTGFAWADVVFTNTAFSRDQAIARGCRAEMIHVLPVGFDLQEFPFVPRRTDPGVAPLRLAVVGRVSRDKGLAFAIEAIGQLAAAHVAVDCTIVGDGDDRRMFQADVAAAGLADRIHFVGTRPHHEVVGMLSASDILLLPSVQSGTWTETQACVLQEAMLVGTMVVASRVGGVPESVPPAMHEFLVAPGDAGAIAGAVRRVAAMSPDQRLARARANRVFCEQRYDVRLLNRRMLAQAMGLPDAERAA
jgi:colanic acid/amylovoran biosynthesis glycosyltransferase